MSYGFSKCGKTGSPLFSASHVDRYVISVPFTSYLWQTVPVLDTSIRHELALFMAVRSQCSSHLII